MDMEKIIEDLHALKCLKVTGSYADGTETCHSDIDFYVITPREALVYGGKNKNFNRIMDVLRNHGITFYGMDGGISTIPPKGQRLDDNFPPVHMEFSTLFNHRKGRAQRVIILEQEFKTH